MIEHIIDPSTIRPGQLAHYECPEPGCSQGYWHIWIEADAVNRFGDPQCRMHGGKRVFLRITEVKNK